MMNSSRSLLRRIATLPFVSPIPTPAIVNPSLLSLSFSSSLSNDDLPSDVSTQELKQRIGKYLEGDAEAIPDIFEAILARKLSGKHEDSDDELMKEFQSKTQVDDEHILMDSESSESSNSDEDVYIDSSDSDEDEEVGKTQIESP